jgi:DNA mismatch endonuclease (patch repair protein)
MADVHNKQTRSYNMSQIKGKNTKPEIIVRKFLFANGFRYRLHVKNLPGKPDIILAKYKTVIFVNGCFWHGHDGCRYFVVPKTRTDWWLNKISMTIKNDNANNALLKTAGWQVIIIYECQLKKGQIRNTFQNLLIILSSQ